MVQGAFRLRKAKAGNGSRPSLSRAAFAVVPICRLRPQANGFGRADVALRDGRFVLVLGNVDVRGDKAPDEEGDGEQYDAAYESRGDKRARKRRCPFRDELGHSCLRGNFGGSAEGFLGSRDSRLIKACLRKR